MDLTATRDQVVTVAKPGKYESNQLSIYYNMSDFLPILKYLLN